jgi:hypothetical protein
MQYVKVVLFNNMAQGVRWLEYWVLSTLDYSP